MSRILPALVPTRKSERNLADEVPTIGPMNARVVLAVLCLLGAFALPVSAQVVTPPVSTVSASGTLSKVGSAQSLPITAGQTVCVVTLSGATSFSVQPEVYSGGIWDFASGFSAITAAGTYVGVIDPTKVSAFSFFVSSLGSGQTLTYTETCGPPSTAITVQ